MSTIDVAGFDFSNEREIMKATEQAKHVAARLRNQTCFKEQGGAGCHPATCDDCGRADATTIDALVAEIGELRDALEAIKSTSWVEAVQDPQKARQIARAALAERGAEIEWLTHSQLYMGQALKLNAMEQQLAAQRRVLEQSLVALQAQPIETRVVWKDGIDLDVPVAHSKLCKAAITAIQEVLL